MDKNASAVPHHDHRPPPSIEQAVGASRELFASFQDENADIKCQGACIDTLVGFGLSVYPGTPDHAPLIVGEGQDEEQVKALIQECLENCEKCRDHLQAASSDETVLIAGSDALGIPPAVWAMMLEVAINALKKWLEGR